MVYLTSRETLSVERLKACHERLNQEAFEARVLARSSPAFSPITSACFRDTFNLRQPDLCGMAREYARAYTTWKRRTSDVVQRLGIEHAPARRMVYASTA